MHALLTVALVLTVLAPADVERALRIGRGSEAERARFHAAYVERLNSPEIEQVEVLTEFRRIVLAQEEHIRRGDHMFSARQAVADVAPWHGKVTILVRVRFHPQNVLARVPAYDIALGRDVKARAVRLTPLYAVRGPNERPGTATPLIGGLVEADFDAAAVGSSTRLARVGLEGKEVASTTFNFARLD